MGYASGGGFRTLGGGLRELGRRYSEIERARKEEDRTATLDQERRDREALVEELLYADRGGGVGPAPPMQRTIGAPMQGVDAPAFLPQPTPPMSRDFLPLPALGGKFDAGVTIEEPDPRFTNVGRGHVMKPGVLEDQQRLEQSGRVRGGFSQMPDMDPELAGALADLHAEDVPIGSLLPPGPDEPYRPTSRRDWLLGLQIDPETERPFRMPGTDYSPTMNQARELVDQTYWMPGTGLSVEDGGTGGAPEFTVSDTERLRLAERLARGEGVGVLPDPEAVRQTYLRDRANVPAAMAGYPQESVARVNSQRDEDMRLPMPTSPVAADTAGSVQSPGPRQVITKDQAEFLRVMRGMPEGEIKRRYDVR